MPQKNAGKISRRRSSRLAESHPRRSRVEPRRTGGYLPSLARNQGHPDPMALDPATVRRIATLARIRMDDAEVTTLMGELNSILGWIEQLNEVDISNVDPLTGAAHMALRLREDAVTDGGYPAAVLSNAPDRIGDFFAVPKVVE